MALVGRRAFLAGSVSALGALGAGPPPADDAGSLDAREIVLSGNSPFARRALVLVPKGIGPGERLPVLVLLHGLAETVDERTGVRAFRDRYGLPAADERLRHPPVLAPSHAAAARYLPEDRRARINRELGEHPYRGFVVVCPYVPNVWKLSPLGGVLDRYASFIVDTLLPEVRSTAPARADPAGAAIDGCSLGGYVALEVFLRRPEAFGAVGSVQAAIGERLVPWYAEKFRAIAANAAPPGVHLETSAWDPYRKASERLSAELRARGLRADLDVLPGGHDQIFLREIGTLEMLLWHSRRFG
jgi:pimeloyl-ACP methyl ester carboxylesterase